MVNFGQMDTVPAEFRNRNLYKHNPGVTLMRTTATECKEIADKLVEKWNLSSGKTVLLLPLKGVSMLDAEGQKFYGPEEDKVLFDTLKDGLDKEKVQIEELDCNINDQQFGETAAQKLIDLMNK